MEATVSQFAGIYREWAPHASLRGHVRCLWINDLSGSRRAPFISAVERLCADGFPIDKAGFNQFQEEIVRSSCDSSTLANAESS